MPRAVSTPPVSTPPVSPLQAEMPEGRGHGTEEQKRASVRHVMESRGGNLQVSQPRNPISSYGNCFCASCPEGKNRSPPSPPQLPPPSRATPTQAFPGHLPSVKLRHECYTTPPGPARRPAPVKGPTLRKTECHEENPGDDTSLPWKR